MDHSPAARSLVERFEGLCLRATADPKTHGSPWTIGYGHTGRDVHQGLIWDQAKAQAILDLDLTTADAGVMHLVGSARTAQPQFDALVSLAFNVGSGALHGSHLIQLHIAGRYADCAAEFLRWDDPGSNVEAGLLRRRKAEAALYLSKGAAA